MAVVPPILPCPSSPDNSGIQHPQARAQFLLGTVVNRVTTSMVMANWLQVKCTERAIALTKADKVYETNPAAILRSAAGVRLFHHCSGLPLGLIPAPRSLAERRLAKAISVSFALADSP